MKKGNERKIAYAMLLTNSLLWGIAPGIIKIGLEEVHPFVYLYYRHLICAVFVLIYFIISGNLRKAFNIFKSPLNLIVMFLLTPGILIVQFYGIKMTSSAEASIAIATAPLFAAVLGSRYLKEKVTKNEKIGTLIAFIGIIALALLGGEASEIPLQQNIAGVSLILMSALIWAGGNILYKKIPKEDRFMVSLDSFFMSVITFFLIFLVWDWTLIIPQAVSAPTFWSIMYMAIPGSLVAFIFVQMGMSLIEVSEATMFTYLQPVWGVPFAIFFLGEHFDLIMFLPIAIIVVGMYVNIKDKLKFMKNRRC